MKRTRLLTTMLMMAMPLASGLAVATDYTVDFSRMNDLEAIRPLVEGCEDFDAMELYRDRMTSSKNLEDMRRTLSAIGLGMFIRCPDGITGPGITPVKQPGQPDKPEYSVDFTRVEDFEVLRPLVKGCADFGALEHFRDRLESVANLNDMRQSLKEVGFGVFAECPPGISGMGITAAKQ
jgi:hypothetical protein